MIDIKIDICIVSVLRPEILETLLKSFKKNMNLNNNRIIINVDPVGEDIPSQKVLDVVYKYFNKIIYNTPQEGNFTKALKWCWSNVETKYFLSLEDDWELIMSVDLHEMINIMEQNENLGQLSLNWLDQSHKKKFGYYKRSGQYFIRPTFTGIPSLIRKSYIDHVLPFIDENKNMEKQLKKLRAPFIFGGFDGGTSKGNLRENGREWREKMGFVKNGLSADFVSWSKVK